LGILVFSLAGGWLFDKIGPNSPFILVGILDLCFALTAIFFAEKFGLRERTTIA